MEKGRKFNTKPLFKVGQRVKYTDAYGDITLHRITKVIEHGEYAGCAPILYETSDGMTVKEFRLELLE